MDANGQGTGLRLRSRGDLNGSHRTRTDDLAVEKIDSLETGPRLDERSGDVVEGKRRTAGPGDKERGTGDNGKGWRRATGGEPGPGSRGVGGRLGGPGPSSQSSRRSPCRPLSTPWSRLRRRSLPSTVSVPFPFPLSVVSLPRPAPLFAQSSPLAALKVFISPFQQTSLLFDSAPFTVPGSLSFLVARVRLLGPFSLRSNPKIHPLFKRSGAIAKSSSLNLVTVSILCLGRSDRLGSGLSRRQLNLVTVSIPFHSVSCSVAVPSPE